MSPGDKLDTSATLDEKLASWPAPTRDDAAWGARAAAILAAAQAAPRAADSSISTLLEPPRLDPEPGEPSAALSPVRAGAGEKVMSQDSNPGGAPSKPESMPSTSTPSKRPSLKELAARASQSGASARPSKPISDAPPAAASKSASDAPPAAKPSIRPPMPSSPPRAADPDHDSGIIDLNKVNASATPEQVAAAEKAQPAAHDLLGDDDKAAAAPAKEAAKVKSIAEAREKKEKGGSGGAIAGLVIALVGIAAGVTIWMRGNSNTPTASTQAAKENAPAAQAAPPPSEPQKVAEAPQAAPQGLSIDSLPSAADPVADNAKPAAQQPSGGGATEPQKAAGTPTPAEKTAEGAPAGGASPASTGKPGDLNGAMAAAVGGSQEKSDDTENAVPAAGGSKGNQNIPEKPSQGSVASAVGSVMPGAKACVAGADDVSRATITFSSAGTVSSVSVTGWAAANGKSGCVKSALQGAKVGPFSQPTFSFPVTIRP